MASTKHRIKSLGEKSKAIASQENLYNYKID